MANEIETTNAEETIVIEFKATVKPALVEILRADYKEQLGETLSADEIARMLIHDVISQSEAELKKIFEGDYSEYLDFTYVARQAQ